MLANTTMARGHVTALLAVLVSLLRRKRVGERMVGHVSRAFTSSTSPRSSRVRPATRSPARADAKPSIGRERTRDGPAPANAGKRASRDAATRRERRGESSGQGTHVRRHLEALCGLPCGCARRRGRGERSSSGSRARFTESRGKKDVSVGYTSRLITHTKRFFHVLKARADSRWRSTRCALMRNEVLHALAARHASRPRCACSRFGLDGASGGTRGVRRRRARAVRCRPRGRCLRGMGRRVPRVDVDAVARSEKVHAEGGGDAHSGACARPRFPGGGAGGPSRDTSAACFPSLAPRRLRDSPPRARSRWTPPRNIT